MPNQPGLGSHVANAGIMVDKEVRGTGVGQQFFDFICRQAKQLGYKAIQANLIVATIEASIKMSQNAGFKIIGTLPNAFHYKGESYVDAHVMFKV